MAAKKKRKRKSKATPAQLRALKKARAARARNIGGVKRRKKRKAGKRKTRATPAQLRALRKARTAKKRLTMYGPNMLHVPRSIAAQYRKEKAAKKRAEAKEKRRTKATKKAWKRYASSRARYAPALSPELAAARARKKAGFGDLTIKEAVQLKRELAKVIPEGPRLVSSSGIVMPSAREIRDYGRGSSRRLSADQIQLGLFDAIKRANPSRARRRTKKRARRRNPGGAWWIADLYKGGRKQTFIDRCSKSEAVHSAKALAKRNGGSRVELSGPYPSQPTASTARK